VVYTPPAIPACRPIPSHLGRRMRCWKTTNTAGGGLVLNVSDSLMNRKCGSLFVRDAEYNNDGRGNGVGISENDTA
jgi:hypothetical protein